MSRRKPLILSTAMTGVRFSPWKKTAEGRSVTIADTSLARNMPVMLDEIEGDAVASYKEGARFIHVHARNPKTGEQFADIDYYNEVTRRIREKCPGAIISYPTSRKGEVEKQIDLKLASLQRLAKERGYPAQEEEIAAIEVEIRGMAVEARPDTITSFTVPEMKMFGDPKDSTGIETVRGWTDPDLMKLYYKSLLSRMKELHVNQEIEVQTLGQFEIMRKLFDFGGMEGPIHLVLLPGFSNGFQISRDHYETALHGVEDFRAYTGLPVTVTCGAVITPQSAKPHYQSADRGKHDYAEVFSWIAEDDRVDVFRTGIEDTPQLYGMDMTNSALVRHAANLCKAHGIDIETNPRTVRERFGFPAEPQKPNFSVTWPLRRVFRELSDPRGQYKKSVGPNISLPTPEIGM